MRFLEYIIVDISTFPFFKYHNYIYKANISVTCLDNYGLREDSYFNF